MKHLIGAGAVVLSVVVVAGCGSTRTENVTNDLPAQQGQEADIELDRKWRGSMDVMPDTAAPGQEVALTYPPGHRDVRGVAFSLSTWAPEGWTITHYLISDAHGGSQPTWWSVEDDEGRGWHDVGVSGPGPDHVVIPTAVTEGTHLLCTANALHEKCALVRVRR